MQFNDHQTLNLRVVDPAADEGVWAIADDGCNSCSHGQQNAETKMKVWGLRPTCLYRKATISNGVGTSTTNKKLKIPIITRLQKSDLVIPGCVRSHEIPEKTHPFVSVPGMPSKAGRDETCS